MTEPLINEGKKVKLYWFEYWNIEPYIYEEKQVLKEERIHSFLDLLKKISKHLRGVYSYRSILYSESTGFSYWDLEVYFQFKEDLLLFKMKI